MNITVTASMDVGQDGRKRQRITTACLGCREKKTKCDGNPSQCSQCQYRDQKCVYIFGENKRKPPSKTYVKALEARIESLEKELASCKATSAATIETTFTTDLPQVQEDDGVMPSFSPTAQSIATPLDEVTDTLGRFQIADGGDVRYFGSRSNFHLLQTAFFSRKSSRQMQQEGYDAVVAKMGLLVVSQDLHDHLLDLFWRWQNTWQYFVPRKLFIFSMEAAGGNPFGRFHSPLLLSAIYALASRYSDRPEVRTDPQDPDTAGDKFMERAKFMLPYESEAATTQTVQAVALLTICETAHDKETLAFITSGMATRMAMNLGLHMDCSVCVRDGSLTVDEAEDRAVTWWGVYLLDKLYNIGLGRPSMIQERDVSAKMPSLDSADELAPWDSGSSTDGHEPTPSHCVSLANYTRKMLSIVAEVLDAVYSPPNPSTSSKKEIIVSQVYVRLVAFHSKLPAHLRVSRSPTPPAAPHVYHLHLQYHVLLILLHRPFLKTTRQNGIESRIEGLDNDDLHSTICRTSAEWICNILRCYRKVYSLRTIPISAIHCVFTAAIFFMADATTTSNKIRNDAYRGLNCCIESLEELETAWSWSTRNLIALANVAHAWGLDIAAFKKPRYQDVIRHRQDCCFKGTTSKDAFEESTFSAVAVDGFTTWASDPMLDFGDGTGLGFPINGTNDFNGGFSSWPVDTMQPGIDWTLPFG